jgi:hypothetical protein
LNTAHPLVVEQLGDTRLLAVYPFYDNAPLYTIERQNNNCLGHNNCRVYLVCWYKDSPDGGSEYYICASLAEQVFEKLMTHSIDIRSAILSAQELYLCHQPISFRGKQTNYNSLVFSRIHASDIDPNELCDCGLFLRDFG